MVACISHLLAVVTLLAAAFAGPSLGAGPAMAAETGKVARVFVPAPPKGKGDKCVADTEFMRRNHMNMLNHQRDDTVHDGIRTKRFSLKECVACHAVQGADARPVTVEDPKHFCRVCHDYAAVKMDCFECHASRPDEGKAAQLPLATDSEALRASLDRYLGGLRR